MIIPSRKFQGASGTTYNYYVFSLDFSPKDHQFGNYMLARQSQEGHWIPVFIGQGNLKERMRDKTNMRHAQKKGATHILARVNENEQLRRVEERDMLVAHPEACIPTGCNENSFTKPAPLRVAQKRN